VFAKFACINSFFPDYSIHPPPAVFFKKKRQLRWKEKYNLEIQIHGGVDLHSRGIAAVERFHYLHLYSIEVLGHTPSPEPPPDRVIHQASSR
jgi:hypothetical protein